MAPHTDRDDFTFHLPRRIRWSECDMQGIVFNPQYLVMADEAMTEYLRGLGVTVTGFVETFGKDFFTVNANIDYRASAVFDEVVEIAMRAARLGNTSMTYAFAFFRGAETLVEGRLTYVRADAQTRRPAPLPEAFVEKILAFEKTPPERKAAAS